MLLVSSVSLNAKRQMSMADAPINPQLTKKSNRTIEPKFKKLMKRKITPMIRRVRSWRIWSSHFL